MYLKKWKGHGPIIQRKGIVQMYTANVQQIEGGARANIMKCTIPIKYTEPNKIIQINKTRCI